MKDRIKQIIQTYGLNAGAFAHKIGVPASTVSYILNGRNQPSAEFFRKVLDIFPAIDANWLIMGSGAMLKNSSIAKTDKIVSEANLPINETNQIIRDTNLLINDTNSISSDVNSTQADNDFANKDIEKVKTHEKSINQGETNLFSNLELFSEPNDTENKVENFTSQEEKTMETKSTNADTNNNSTQQYFGNPNTDNKQSEINIQKENVRIKNFVNRNVRSIDKIIVLYDDGTYETR